VIVAEMNMGQLISVLRERFLVEAVPINHVQGQPFKTSELVAEIGALAEEAS